MLKFKKILSHIILLCCLPVNIYAAGSGVVVPEMQPKVDLTNLPSLQRGAKLYMQHCIGCHSLKYQRYERTADFLKVPHELFLKALVHDPDVKIGNKMYNSMTDDVGRALFGSIPPDLTLVSRLRGNDWIYAYLKSFYRDDERPFGVNNDIFENVGMPHVLADLQGIQEKGCRQIVALNKEGWELRDPITSKPILTEECDVLIPSENSVGQLSKEEYDQVVYDIVNFLYYVGEPSRLDRYRIGVYVLIFLAVFFGFAFLLNREYWKDVK